MSGASSISGYWNKLSAREKVLIGVAGVVAAVLGAIYLGLLPGMNAARSAESRRAHAITELANVQGLANELAAMRAAALGLPEGDANALAQDLAVRHGVTIIQSGGTDGGLEASVEATTSANVLNWIGDLSANTGLGVKRFTLTRGGAGVVATISLQRAS